MKMRKYIYSLALFSFLFFSFHFSPGIVNANASEGIIIDRFPSEELFLVDNTKPGDTVYRSLQLQNNHELDILYTLELRNGGDLKLFNALQLEIKMSGEVMFHDELKNFEGFKDRPLHAQSSEIIGFKLKFPDELGNEYQGLTAEFGLIFHAKTASDNGLMKGVINAGSSSLVQGGTLPHTATNMFTYLLIGSMLILIGGVVNYLNSKKVR